MSALTHSVTGHKITTDEKSVKFWKAAGYRVDEEPKTTTKKSSPKKSSSTKK